MFARGSTVDPCHINYADRNYVGPYGTYVPGNQNVNDMAPVTPYLTPGEDTAVIVVVSQSLECNYTSGTYVKVSNRIHVLNIYNGGVYDAVDPILGVDGTQSSYLIRMADKLIASGRYERVILVPTGVGGADTRMWIPANDNQPAGVFNHRIGVALQRLTACGLVPTEVLIGMGTTDNSLNTSEEVIAAGQLAIINQFKASLPPTVRYFVMKESWVGNQIGGGPGDLDSAVRAGQAAIVNEAENIFAGADKDTIEDRYDAAHFDAVGGDLAAEKSFAKILEADAYSDLLFDMRLAQNEVNDGGSVTTLAGFYTTTRALDAFIEDSTGLLIKFAPNTLRWSDLGVLVEFSRTNFCLHNRDLSNAAWVKTNCAAALNMIGADGVPNAASALVASGANATCLQTLTFPAGQKFMTAYVKRGLGIGVVEMTMDNVTWTPITLPVGSFARVTIPTQSLTDPTIGFRIVTSGDAIVVDLVQCEEGIFATSPIETGAAPVARPTDVVTRADTFALPMTVVVEAEPLSPVANTSNQLFFVLDDGTANNRVTLRRDLTTGYPAAVMTVGGVSVTSTFSTLLVAENQNNRLAYAADDSDQRISDGTTSASGTLTPVPTGLTRFVLGSNGSGGFFNGYISRIKIYDGRQIDATVTALAA